MIESNIDLDTQILKMSKKFASLHPRYFELYGGFDDYIEELNFAIFKNLHSYDKDKGAFSTWCYTVFETKIIRDTLKKMKKNMFDIQSLDVPINEGNENLIDIITDDIDYREKLERRLFVKRIVQKILPKVSPEFIQYAVLGKGIAELAREKSVSNQNMSVKIKREIIKLRKIIEENERGDYEYIKEIYY